VRAIRDVHRTDDDPTLADRPRLLGPHRWCRGSVVPISGISALWELIHGKSGSDSQTVSIAPITSCDILHRLAIALIALIWILTVKKKDELLVPTIDHGNSVVRQRFLDGVHFPGFVLENRNAC